MRPPIMLVEIQATAVDQERHRDEDWRHELHRSRLEGLVERPSIAARLQAIALRAVLRDRRALTGHPCRLPDGRIGRTATIQHDGDWILVCRIA